MSDNELLLAISNLMDAKLDARLKPMQESIKRLELTLENEVIPRLQNIESCYTSTYERYQTTVEEHEAMKQDIMLLKNVVSEHSEKLKKIS